MSTERAVALHQAGNLNEAADMYAALLRTAPANADLWGLLSIAQMQLDKPDEAMRSWRKCLSLDVPAPVRLRTIAKFLLAARQKDKTSLPTGLLDGLDIPEWPNALPLDPANQKLIVTLARCLVDFDRQETALRLLDSILARPVNDPEFVAALAPIMVAAGNPARLLEVLRPLTSSAHKDNGVLLIAHAAAAAAARHHKEAEEVSRRAREAIPVFLSAKMPGQRLLIGVLNSAPRLIREISSPDHLHFHQNTPTTLLSKMNDEFRFLSIFPEAESTKQALQALPRPDLIINNWVNPEILSQVTLGFIAPYADSFGVPVINHPRRACLTTRQQNAERLAGIQDAVVPRIMLVVSQPEERQSLVGMIEEKLGFPVIIRNAFGQRGSETVKVATPAELASYLLNVRGGQQLYAIEYVHNARPEGVFRKMRMAVIGGEPFMLNVYFGAQWNVHRADRDRLTGPAAAFAQKALRYPEEALGRPAMTALNEIAARTPLDIFGIDFDLMPDGRILFFEANASMNLSMREKEDLPETLFAMRKAYRRLFENPHARLRP